MSIRRAALKGTALVGAGRMLDQGLQFGRNIIVARLLSPEDFGIAALFAMTISLLEMISNLAVDTLLVQSPRGDEPEFQQTSQLMMVVRGVLLGSVMFLFAGPVSRLFDVPQAAWAFRLLAVVPMIRGLAHQDMSRMQRQLNFKPVLITDVTSHLISFAFALPLASWLGNYSAILYLILIQTLSRTVMSHFMAERSYRWTWEPQHARQIVSFGWPLLINGILLFLIVQGDRFVIGAADTLFSRETYSKTLLGLYSVAISLSSVADAAIWSIISPILLPLLSRVQDSPKQFQKRYEFSIQSVSAIAGPLGILFIILGSWFIVLIYGEQYRDAGPLIIWLGAAQSFRLIRRVPTLAALAKGDSRNPTISNVFRASTFILCFFLAARGADIVWIAACSLLGEILALMICVGLLRYRFAIPVKPFMQSVIFPVTAMGMAAVIGNSDIVQSHLVYLFLGTGLLSAGVLSILLLSFGDFRKELRFLFADIYLSCTGFIRRSLS